ncbi:putative SOS response-associated peptidase YedK [Cytobacillus purgationiresistens]|uniref:SOS response-associated peptidase YedK n=1 Tax=Cytobacillus purgationiresistens TaxID=863449 RepID=A0ABU0ADQ9_9BACI|nr:putative SOS response-associated peptidase YedK [Cytobacillus purgationiresistens]
MPVILNPKDEEKWLDPTNPNTDLLDKLLVSFDHEKMEAFEVSTEINSPKNNSPQLIKTIC